MKGSVPVLGDLPLVGPLFRSESKNTQKRNLLGFITPTILTRPGIGCMRRTDAGRG